MKRTTKIIIYSIAALIGVVLSFSVEAPTVVLFILVGGMLFFAWMVITLGSACGQAVTQMNEAEKQRREQHEREEQAQRVNARAEYEKICNRVAQTLENAEKPERCNTVRFTDKPFLFSKMKSFQYMAKWQIWRFNETLYLYQEAVEMYPVIGLFKNAPEIGTVAVNDIQYFKAEGEVETNTYVVGGKVTQDKKTEKVSQTALKNKTVTNDTRVVKMSVVVDGIVETLKFNKESYDVFLLLIPEKEYHRVIQSS